MDRIISEITGFISSIQNLFYRVEDGTRRTSRFAQWLGSFNWQDKEEEEDEDEDEEEEI